MQTDHDKRFSEIKRVLVVVLALNWLVAAAKIIYGLVTNFTSMTADGFHSLSDGTSNIIGLVGITLACRPPDKDHPYGHKKYETLSSLGIAALLFFVCFNLAKEGLKRLYHPLFPQVNGMSLAVMIITIVINVLVMKYEYKAGKRLKSDILVSDSLHTRADIFTSISVVAAMASIKLGFPVLDPIVTIMIAAFIAHAAINILSQGSNVLCDTIVVMDDKKIADVVLSVKGVRTCHKIRTRGREDDIHVDLHVQVHPDMHVGRAHEISYKIENAIKENIQGVTDVVVHIEPKKK